MGNPPLRILDPSMAGVGPEPIGMGPEPNPSHCFGAGFRGANPPISLWGSVLTYPRSSMGLEYAMTSPFQATQLIGT